MHNNFLLKFAIHKFHQYVRSNIMFLPLNILTTKYIKLIIKRQFLLLFLLSPKTVLIELFKKFGRNPKCDRD